MGLVPRQDGDVIVWNAADETYYHSPLIAAIPVLSPCDWPGTGAVWSSGGQSWQPDIDYASGFELHGTSLGGGYGAVSFVPDTDLDDGPAANPSNMYHGLLITYIDEEGNLSVGSLLKVFIDNYGFYDSTDLTYLGNDIIFMGWRGGYECGALLRVDRGSLTASVVLRVTPPGGVTVPDPATAVVLSDGQGRGILAVDEYWNGSAYAIGWITTSPVSVSWTYTDSGDGYSLFQSICFSAGKTFTDTGQYVGTYGGAGKTNYPAVWDINWSSKTYSYVRELRPPDWWYQYASYGESDVIPGAAPGTVDFVYSSTDDKLSLVTGVPVDGSSMPSREIVSIRDLAQASDIPFMRFVHLVRLGDGSLQFSYLDELFEARIITRRFLSGTKGHEIFAEPGSNEGWWFRYYDGHLMFDLGNSRLMYVWASLNDVEQHIYMRSACANPAEVV